jgi:hypothetical protein
MSAGALMPVVRLTGLAAGLLFAACTGNIGDARSGAGGSAGAGAGTPPGGGGGSPPSVLNCTGSPPPAPARAWRLTTTQIVNTLRDQFGFVPPSIGSLPADTRLDGFANQSAKLTISPFLAETYFAMGHELGANAVANPGRFGITCEVSKLAPGTCLSGFLSTTGQKMWRRPLTPAELSSLTTLFTTTSGQGGPAAAVTSVVQALFLSPNFLHRTELGTVAQAGAVTPLTDHEIASSLSYLLWDSAPDDELLSLASQSKLRDRTVLVAQARRLFEARDRSGPAINNFLQQWLRIENLSLAVKDAAMFPMAAPEIVEDLKEELRLYANSILFDAGGDRSFKTLFTASYAFVNARTAPIYGITGVTGNALVRRDLDRAQRRGVISMAPFLWGKSHASETNLVGRGAYFRAELLCHRVPLPAGGVPPGAFAPPNSTGRQKFEIHSTGGCASCHQLFDGIGFALENYDPIGRFRTTEYGQMIDPTGTLPLPSENNALPGMAFSNFVDLVDKLAEKPDLYGCFAQQYTSYAAGRDLPEIDACEKKAIADQFAQANYKIDELMLAVVGSPNFVDRKN